LDKLEEEKKRIVVLFRKGYIKEDEMEDEMKPIDTEIKGLKGEVNKYEKQINNISKNQLNVEILKSTIEDIKDKLKNEDVISFKLKRQIVDIFIDEVILKWEDNELKVTAIGIIDLLLNSQSLRQLSTQWETDIDTTNIIFNLAFESQLLVDSSGREVKYKVKDRNINIS
jgi:site-specific DNA recombinase